MKFIEKQKEPQEFLDWKSLANDNWQPTFSALSGSEKAAVKKALIEEQGCICCYCESRVTDNDSHIEHFRPQSDSSVDPLDFSNMLCSCQNNLEKGAPRHCGHLKDEWFDSSLLISPLDNTCETRFSFTADGYIQAYKESDQAASTTIEKLGLDIPKLRALRKSVIEPFLDADLSESELLLFVAGYLEWSGSKLNEFWTTIRYLFDSSI
jgi:uncharacterized protein (TIGR02646 family)